jgi:catechol 2,3-dioxygenase-like lactoylglutathione lyase family enzyme
MDQTTRISIDRVGTVAIPVADQDRALAFYVDTLGFELRRDMTYGNGSRWIEVAPQGALTTVALAPPGDLSVGVDTGIRLFTADAEADHAALTARGADVSDMLRFGGPVPPMFTFRDPDGNQLVIVQLA